MTEEKTELKNALSQLLEPSANGDAHISAAISLKRIADKMAETTPKSPPQVLHRTIERRE